MKQKTLLISISSLAILSISAVLFYQKYYLPRQIIKSSFRNLQTVKSFEFSANLSTPTAVIKSQGKIDFQEGATSTSDIHLTDNQFSLDTIFIANQFYAKIYDTQIAYFSNIKNYWLEIDPSYLPNIYTGKGFKLNFDSSTKDKLLASVKENSPFSRGLYFQNEKFASKDVYHLQYKIDKTKFLNTLKALSSDSGNSKEIETNIDQSFKEINFKTGELWLDKKDKLPRKIILEARESNSKKYQLEVTFSNYNQNFEIEKPKNSIKLDDVSKQNPQ